MENRELIQAIKNEFAIALADSISYTELHNLLSDYINGLIQNDFEKLVAHLYRIDVNELTLKKLLQQDPKEDAGKIIAAMIIERQQQKIMSRSQFSGGNNSINEEEKS